MRSSGSTPHPPGSRPPRLLLWIVGNDDPRACTGLRLLRFGRARRVDRPERLRPPPILLDPHAPTPLSRADLTAARRGGILAVDCSWNRLAERGGLPLRFPRDGPAPVRRRLPFLLAANPQHFGRLSELNTVEALSAALYLLGYRQDAADLLEGFRGGLAFLEVNREPLDGFAGAPTAEQLLARERQHYGGGRPSGG